MSYVVSDITNGAVSEVLDRLAANGTYTEGFNELIEQKFADMGIDADFSIDFESGGQLIKGRVGADVLEKAGTFRFPFIALYVDRWKNGGADAQKFNKFSGQLQLGLDFWWSVPNQTGLQDFNQYSTAVESVIVDIINRENNQIWPNPLVYNGDIGARRSAIYLAGSNWRQAIEFSLLFGVHTL